MNAVAQRETFADTLRDYIRAGLVLVPIPNGTKAPKGRGWNDRRNCWTRPEHVPADYTGNVGLAHAYAGTMALDVDNAAKATAALSALGIDLAALLAAPDAVHIRSGRPGRDKLLYRLPAGMQPLPSMNRNTAGEGFELRCAASNGRTVQDVLPPSIHPDTGKPYTWAGDWHAIPDAPADLLTAWHRLLDGAQAATPANVTPIARKQRRKLPDVILEGERNATLLSLAAGFVRKGYGAQAVNDRLQLINAKRCTPPLGADEVDDISAQAVGYGSKGFRILTDALLDSRELNALPLASRWIIVTAIRRSDGTGAPVALTWNDCRDIPGCADEGAFLRYRALAVASSILQCKRKGGMTQTGRKPDQIPENTPSAAHTNPISPEYSCPLPPRVGSAREASCMHLASGVSRHVGGNFGGNRRKSVTQKHSYSIPCIFNVREPCLFIPSRLMVSMRRPAGIEPRGGFAHAALRGSLGGPAGPFK